MDAFRSALFAVLGLLAAVPASAQTLDAQADWSLSLWPQSHQRYWHNAELNVKGQFRWSRLTVGLYGHIGAWGAAPTRFDDSQANPFIAEFVRTLERSQGVYLGTPVGGWMLGVQLHRRNVHHVWRHRNNVEGRHDYFPVEGGWKEGRKHCTDDDREPLAPWTTGGDCPSLGYSERLGVRLARVSGPLTGFVTVLPIRYKTLTLPPSVLLWGVGLDVSPVWRIEAEGSVDVTGIAYGTAQIKRKALDRLWVSLEAGRQRDPGWKRGFWIVALTIGSK